MDNFVGSWGFVMFAAAILVFMLWLYPVIVFVGSWVNEDPGTDRHRLTAAKLALLEGFLVDVVNEMRRERGVVGTPIREPLVASFQGHGWRLLRAKVRQAAVAAVVKLSWVRQVPS
jgi:hypothetical protein